MEYFHEGREKEVRVFSKERLCAFLEDTAMEFIELIEGGRK